MSDRILLDLSRGEFDDDYKKNELWQQGAARQLIETLASTGQQAKSYRKKRSDGGKLQAIHDAIFVAGARGTGKSVFLRNAETIWKNANQNIKLYFCAEIDPTLLVNHDNFANVVIAHLYNEVDDSFEKDCCGKNYEHRDNFYLALKKLANALGQAEHNDEQVTGIDRIVGYRSGIQLEKYFHEFAEQCRNILKVDAIVLPIDDVDMALGRAYEVLDVVRRLLGCPLIIPIVSGDINLYRPILEDHFSKLGRSSGPRANSNAPKVLEGSIPQELTKAYLTKVFQSQLRIVLKPIDQLLHKLDLGDPAIKPMSYTDYENDLKRTFYTFTNGEEKSTDWPKPECAREIYQLTSALRPSKITELHNNTHAFKNWAYVKQHGAAYSDSVSIEQLKASDVKEFSLGNLMSFNLIQQAREPDVHWKNINFYAEQDEAISLLKLGENNQKHLLNDLKEKPLFRSMPTLEYYTPQLVIPKFEQQLKGKQPNVCVLAALYTHRNYYGKAEQTSAQIFFSKAFDLLVTSLLIAREPVDDNREEFWMNILVMHAAQLPFYSVYSVAPTKVVDDESTESSANAEDISELSTSTQAGFRKLAVELVEWEIHYGKFLVHMQSLSLLPLISAVFNKVFTQLHMLRVDRTAILKEDFLTDLVKRFEYIVVNSFATFMKPSPVVLTNIARTVNPKNIRDFNVFKKTSNAFRHNVISFVGGRDDILKEEVKGGFSNKPDELLKAIWAHPLFGLIDNQPSKNDSPVSDIYIWKVKQNQGAALDTIESNSDEGKKVKVRKKRGKSLPMLKRLVDRNVDVTNMGPRRVKNWYEHIVAELTEHKLKPEDLTINQKKVFDEVTKIIGVK